MHELEKVIRDIIKESITKMIISKPSDKTNIYKKIVIERKKEYYQAAKYTEKQVFHENVSPEDFAQYLLETIGNAYLQVNAWDLQKEHILLLSKKGKVTYKTKALPGSQMAPNVNKTETADMASDMNYTANNRKKNYILEE